MDIVAMATAGAMFVKSQALLALTFLGFGASTVGVQVAVIAALVIVPIAVVVGLFMLLKNAFKSSVPPAPDVPAPSSDVPPPLPASLPEVSDVEPDVEPDLEVPAPPPGNAPVVVPPVPVQIVLGKPGAPAPLTLQAQLEAAIKNRKKA